MRAVLQQRGVNPATFRMPNPEQMQKAMLMMQRFMPAGVPVPTMDKVENMMKMLQGQGEKVKVEGSRSKQAYWKY